MNHCPHCGKVMEEACSFCPYCGKQLPTEEKPPVKTQKPSPKRIPKKAALLAIPLVLLVLVLLLMPSGKSFSEDTDAIAKASASVVTIYTYDVNNLPLSSGSGFAAIEDGIIVTNHHVIDGDTYRIEVIAENGSVMNAETVVCMDAAKDIAILRCPDSDLAPLSTDPGLEIERGETLTAIGSPIGLSNMVSTGVFSSYKSDGINLFQLFTTSISHGSSGGALFDEEGNVVGVTSGGYEEGNEIYYAIPFYDVAELYENRTLADEITPAKLWQQQEHSYTVDYVIFNARALNGQTIELKGYAAALYHDLYLAAQSSEILSTKPIKSLEEKERTKLSDLMFEKQLDGSLLLCQREKRNAFDDELAGKYVTLRGKVVVYGENQTGDDVRFIVSEVIAKE